MGNTKLLQRAIFMLIALSFTSSLFALSREINLVANDEVVTAEEVYDTYCSPEEYRALAKKVRDGASFIPFREKDLLKDGYKYVEGDEMDFKDIVLDKDSTKEEIQEEIDKYKRNAKIHRIHLLDFIESFRQYPDSRLKFDKSYGVGFYMPHKGINKGRSNFYRLIGGYDTKRLRAGDYVSVVQKSNGDYLEENCRPVRELEKIQEEIDKYKRNAK